MFTMDVKQQHNNNNNNFDKNNWDRHVGENIEDPDQTAPKEQSDQGLQSFPSHLHF